MVMTVTMACTDLKTLLTNGRVSNWAPESCIHSLKNWLSLHDLPNIILFTAALFSDLVVTTIYCPMVGMVLVDQLWEKLMVNITMIISILFLSGSCLSLIHPIKVEAWSLASQDTQETSSQSQCPSHQQNHTATSRFVILRFCSFTSKFLHLWRLEK